ncbi:hypothetical protein UP09_05455 [Bradyrhizobium sp. LTSP885]|uniref:ABC transporter substrate-binding protein n=1 Tax=Bradyrhizobium sp. LTSP885 TaxID=1619232 RepID=UPI0005DC08D1|nr:extracellular solute-binding protein [Bradyrhizobium sp. LTSP885]KJC50457.1 hypothetical protein UP09_05455 [Bradyrhizobium sp. LTSP885]
MWTEKTTRTGEVSRREVLGAVGLALASPFVLRRDAWAEGKSINVGVYVGNSGEIIKKYVVPGFEAKYRCKVNTTSGLTLTQINTMRVQHDNPQYSVMCIDDSAVPVAKAEDLIVELTDEMIPNAKNVFARFRLSHGLAYAASACGLFFNPSMNEPLQSYEELWLPRWRKQIITRDPANTMSVFTSIMAASVALGKPFSVAQYELDKAWPKLAELKPNLLTVFTESTQAMLVVQGQASYGGVETSKTVYPLMRRGASMDLCYPKEGAFGLVNCMIMVKNGPQPELSAAFIDWTLERDVQRTLGEKEWSGPTVSGLEFAEGVAKRLPYPETKMEAMNLFVPDWTFLNGKRAEIIEKLNGVFKG